MSRRERRKSAAALAYDAKGGDNAPRVIAKGYGLVAEMIIQRAQEAGLYVHRAPEMVSLLMQVDLDSRIPPELYQAVAELLAWLYRLESGVADEEAGGESVSAEASSNTGETEAPLAGRYDYPRLPT
ncbi:EscU/YscU/HrcU family type III secretion system export apparatus switch protein [Trinickia sp. Y13]|uniref:EscU/YscU/HrcU family type III secretion system export apparatus switch protein n=1 Tax=Trinickia sp. Y13 TaxID=2917807 RepID=UPI002405039A|nr:EscU/YscU/HrcU family type III secretion system export apparatus switch protein [Trinickia sp. Y13]MDG0026801.1 EscU/YscU/HrcU family type III secretion system export apparatus switch protein [Trinickia sp. Y13]